MKNMKRLIAVMLMLTLALCCVACGGEQNPSTTTTQETEPSSEPSSSATQPSTTNPPTPSHTVLVVDQDGNPVEGIAIQLCDEGSCYNPVATNENGIAEFFMHGIVGAKAKIYALKSNPTEPYGKPGYTIDANDTADEEGYIHFGDSTTITLTVTKVTE